MGFDQRPFLFQEIINNCELYICFSCCLLVVKVCFKINSLLFIDPIMIIIIIINIIIVVIVADIVIVIIIIIIIVIDNVVIILIVRLLVHA